MNSSLAWLDHATEDLIGKSAPCLEVTRQSCNGSRNSNHADSTLSAFDGRIEYLMILAQTLLQEIERLKESSQTLRHTELNLPAEVRRIERELLRNTLIRTGGRQRRAARLLGMKVTTLNTKIKRYQIKLDITQ